jgi:hypothetical protein
MIRLLILCLCALLLTSCTTSPAPSSVVAQCYPVVNYTPDQEAAQASAYASLPISSPLRSALDDYGHERAALRACAGVK